MKATAATRTSVVKTLLGACALLPWIPELTLGQARSTPDYPTIMSLVQEVESGPAGDYNAKVSETQPAPSAILEDLQCNLLFSDSSGQPPKLKCAWIAVTVERVRTKSFSDEVASLSPASRKNFENQIAKSFKEQRKTCSEFEHEATNGLDRLDRLEPSDRLAVTGAREAFCAARSIAEFRAAFITLLETGSAIDMRSCRIFTRSDEYTFELLPDGKAWHSVGEALCAKYELVLFRDAQKKWILELTRTISTTAPSCADMVKKMSRFARWKEQYASHWVQCSYVR